ncbi:MAG: hypothetical protein IJA34_07220 [Lachnospiraceae bacterium]|nr:hypothetical protein [Lachnospiraceae bacterium]
MSKINAVRLINLNYNNNSIRISDETFQFNGQSTLLSLRNGGGKSVLVQMMTAPFVHKQYRKTKDRPFESYFTTSKPTFIMVEWKLDQGAGYCLTGMMVRRSQASEEQSSEPLEIINFVSEYSSRCDYDIFNIPLVEKNNKETILKNFNECKQIFEMYKKDNSKKFYYYDMNNSAQSRQYFDKIAEYKIYYKEWETIIRKVNLKESGLSELFSDCKNEKELVDKWFLETIQDKLNQGQNRVKEFQSIIDKYVRMYKENKSKIERRNTILKFKDDMKEIEDKAYIYQNAENNVKNQENKIACLIKELKHLEEKLENNKNELEINILECNTKIEHISYERISLDVYKLFDELRYCTSNRDMIQVELDALNDIIREIEKKIHIYECAKAQENVDEENEEYELLKQKIDVSKKEEQELEPERIKIGGWLKKYYQTRIDVLESKQKETEGKYLHIEENKQKQIEKEQKYQKEKEELINKIAICNNEIKYFSEKENNFNKNYGESFERNILGDYEPGFLDIKKEDYEKQCIELVRSCKLHIEQCGKEEDRKKSAERDKEDKEELKQRYILDLHRLEQENEHLKSQINERKTIMKYLDISESIFWQTEEIIKNLDRKLSEIERKKSDLEQERISLNKEWKKLTSGEILELPQEFEELLNELELHPVYGMNWLEKNGNSVEENTMLVRKHPFIPYALIMPKQEIMKLETYGKEIYTSFPVPLIPRESLNEILNEDENSILNMQGVSFYVWFNEKLLDEDALKVLINQKELEIRKTKEQIELKSKEYQEYSEKRSILHKQTLTKDLYDKNISSKSEVNTNIANIEKEILGIKEEITKLSNTIEELKNTIQNEKNTIEKYNRRRQDFELYCLDYKKYQEQRKDKEQFEQLKLKYEEKLKNSKSLQNKYNEELKSLDNERYSLQGQSEVLYNKLNTYEIYETDVKFETETTPEELEKRYEAITTKMSYDIQSLEEQMKKSAGKLKKVKKELENLQIKYKFEGNEWKDVIFNRKELMHQETLLEDKQRKAKERERLWNVEDKKAAVLKSQIDEKKKAISDEFGKEEPLPKEEIITVDFDAEINKLKYQFSELRKDKDKVEQNLQNISSNIGVLAEFEEFVVVEDVIWEDSIENMDSKGLNNFTGIMRRDYRNMQGDLRTCKDKLEKQIDNLLRKEEYKEDYYHKPLETMISVTESASLVLAQLATTIQSYDTQMQKLLVDIDMVEKEKERVIGLLEDYIKDVHNNMNKIDNNSTITVRERPIKMLRIQIPDWEENEGVYHQRFEDFMDDLTKNGIEIYERNENAGDYFSSRITTKNMYDNIVGIGNVQIKLYKIEEQREYPITWAEVARNSGGEGFLSAFVILSSLLQYMRRDETDIFADRNEGKVLVMDNPFAQTNASHLLKPLMDMAKKTNTQLICLSGLGGYSIYSRFDNIYVLNLVTASLRGGMQYLRGEHKKGVEEEIMVTSQIEVYEQQTLLF